MVGGHVVLLAAFLLEPEPAAVALGIVVLDVHGDDGADAANVRTCSPIRARSRRPIRLGGRLSGSPGWGRGPILSGMLFRSRFVSSALMTGVSPLETTCLGPRTAWAGLSVDDLADDEPVEEHADGGEVLLDRGLGVAVLELLDVPGDGHRFDRLEIRVALALAPGKKRDGVAEVRAAGMRVLNVDGEVFGEAVAGVRSGGVDDRRGLDRGDRGEDFALGRNSRQILTGR